MSWRELFASTPATRIALYTEDRERFTAALFAAWSLRKTIVLPGDALPRTVDALATHCDAFAGELPGALPTPATSDERCDAAQLDLEAEHLVLFTSGSTGAPQAVPKKLRQLVGEVRTLEATFGPRVGRDVTVFSTVSHQHIYGLLWAVLWPALTGKRLSPRRTEYPEQLEPLLSATPSVLISSPAHLKRLPDDRAWSSQLRAVFSSGGPLPPEGAAMSRKVLQHQPIEIYGSTETGGIAWRQGLDHPWTPLTGVDLRAGEGGTLEVRSPHLPDDAWFTTSDRIELHDGAFTLKGRVDRIAKIEEKRVSLDLIERVARETGLLTDARVITIAGQRTILGLVGVPSHQGRLLDRPALIARLKAAFTGAIERVAHPRRYRFLDVLPHNEQGKTPEALLSPLFAADRPDPTWTERTATRAVGTMHLDGTLRVFDGHFPGTPVVPGVAQLDWAIRWARELFGLTGRFTRMDALKYQRLMTPGHTVTVELDWSAARQLLTFKFSSPRGTYSSGRVTLSA